MNAGEQLIAQGEARGLEKGRVEGGLAAVRSLLEKALAARGVPLSELGRARIVARTELEMLNAWALRALTATSETDVFGER